ncbi:MAG: WXG100 family type VII secretion target [Defluviitaleaceae bacterium]|nr:WXG100 family type VII secretion target [Defluviitaleaceae bacterium]
MARIQVTPDFLESEASRLGQYINQHDSNIHDIKTLVNNLSTEWAGEAQNSFYAQFQSQEQMFRNFRDTLERFRQLMNTAARTMREADDTLRAQINSAGF